MLFVLSGRTLGVLMMWCRWAERAVKCDDNATTYGDNDDDDDDDDVITLYSSLPSNPAWGRGTGCNNNKKCISMGENKQVRNSALGRIIPVRTVRKNGTKGSCYYLGFYFLVSRKIHGNAKKNAMGRFVAWYHVSCGCNARPSDRIVETSGARAGRPLDRAAKGAPTLLERRPCLAVPRELNFRLDKALHAMKIAGDFVLISAMSVSRLCRLDE